MFHLLAEGLGFLRTIDPVEPDTSSLVVVQDFEGVAVEDGDDGTGEVVAQNCRSFKGKRLCSH